MSLRIGITGGIGAGKSIVSKVIQAIGYKVFNSDDEAKKILNSDPVTRSELIELFGELVYDSNGLNRTVLAEIIFNNPEAREKVNSIVHPKVRLAFDKFVDESEMPLVFNEAAILFETGAYNQFDKTILITAPIELRLDRVTKRDQSSSKEVLKRMNAQWSDDKKIKLADFVIENDEKKPLLSQIEATLKALLLI